MSNTKFFNGNGLRLLRHPANLARWLSLHPGIIFLVWSLWLAIPYYGFGAASYVRIHDNGDSILSAVLAFVNHIKEGGISYWDSSRIAGVDRISSHIIYFTNFPFIILPGWLAHGLVMWLQRFIAGFFTFKLLRSLKLNTLPSIYAGLLYAMFAQPFINNAWAGYTLYDDLGLPGIPFFLWAFSMIDTKHRYQPYLYALGLGSFLAFGLSYAFAPFVLIVIVIWFYFIDRRVELRFWLICLLFILVWLIFSLPIIWASLISVSTSHRAYWQISSPLAKGWVGTAIFAIKLVKSNIISLGIAILGLMFPSQRDRRLVTSTIIIVTCLLFVASYPLLKPLMYNYLGFLSSFQFNRIYLIIPFLAIIASALSLNSLMKGSCLFAKKKDIFHNALKVVIAFIIGVAVYQSLAIHWRILGEMVNGSTYGTLYRQPVLEQLAKSESISSPFRVATVSDPSRHALHPAYIPTYGLESVDGYVNIYPHRYQSFWGAVIFPLTSADSNRDAYFHYWGSRVYLFSPSGGFEYNDAVDFSSYYDLQLLSLANVRYIVSPLPLKNTNLKVLAYNSIDEVANWNNGSLVNKFLSLMQGDSPPISLYLYENQTVFPRFFLVTQASVLDGSSEVLNELKHASLNDLRSTAYVIEEDVKDVTLNKISGKGTGKTKLHSYSSDKIILDVNADAPSILVISNSYNPYWKVWIDGKRSKVFPVNLAFQGVYLDAGTHEVVLEYKPPYAVGFSR